MYIHSFFFEQVHCVLIVYILITSWTLKFFTVTGNLFLFISFLL